LVGTAGAFVLERVLAVSVLLCPENTLFAFFALTVKVKEVLAGTFIILMAA